MISNVIDAGGRKLDPIMDKGQKTLLSSNAKPMGINQDKPGIWSPTDKSAPVKVMTTDGTLTWQGT
eukprot:13382722-Ditylum_brightwellii.AAC.1